MTRPRTKTIDGYQVQPNLPVSFPYFGGRIEEADFTTFDDTGTVVEVLIRMGLINNPYTLILSIDQAREADIIERV